MAVEREPASRSTAPRFDEVELLHDPMPLQPAGANDPPRPAGALPDGEALGLATRASRLAAFATDLSLFAAAALAMIPLLPEKGGVVATVQGAPFAVSAISAFLLLFSFFYFAGCWSVWGRTIGGTIFDVHVVSADRAPLDVRHAAIRWGLTLLSILSAGLGFLPALLRDRRSLADRVAKSMVVRG